MKLSKILIFSGNPFFFLNLTEFIKYRIVDHLDVGSLHSRRTGLDHTGALKLAQGIDDHGMADKELRLLQPGDELTTIWYMASFEGEDDFEPYTADTFTVTVCVPVGTRCELTLPDGTSQILASGTHTATCSIR